MRNVLPRRRRQAGGGLFAVQQTIFTAGSPGRQDRLVSADELVEVLDANGDVVAVVTRRVMRHDNLRHRAVFVAVVDAQGRLLVHRRSAAKDVWPSRWDVAVGGVLAPGEAPADGARRELAEEMGIDDPGELVALGQGRYTDDDVDVDGFVYRARHDGPLVFRDGEVVAAEWLDEPALERRLTADPFVPDSVAIVLPLLGRDRRGAAGARQ